MAKRSTKRSLWTDGGQTEPAVLIEDHALLGDLYTAALVARDGSIDFLCLPEFDSDATFTSLLGSPENGRWKIAPTEPVREVRRQYRGNSLVLETSFVTDRGEMRLVDFLVTPREDAPHLVRLVEGISGEVPVRFDLRPRFGSGLTVPRVRILDGATAALAGPDGVYLRNGGGGGTPPPFEADFVVAANQRIPFVLSWAPPYEPVPAPVDPDRALAATLEFWEDWARPLRLPPAHRDVVLRSLLTLKACTFAPTGAIVAAPTFGLPETPGGERNWDYRYCWIRDSVLTLNALMRAGLEPEARGFGRWLSDAIGGAPSQVQIMYGIRGERRLTEVTLDWLSGFGGARPVRIGNGAYNQFQLDVMGEFALALEVATNLVGTLTENAEGALRTVANRVAESWTQPDHGIWEMRGPKRHFTASKVSAWATIDRWVKAIEKYGLKDDPAPWRELRQRIFDEIIAKGFDPVRNTFTQYYGSTTVDASLLFIPLSDFLPATDPRVVGTVSALEEDLMQEGLLLRYRTDQSDDGLAGDEGVFLACSFWLANTYQRMGREKDARALFERLIALRNDVGLLAEEYHTKEQRRIGNFPQAFSHLALVQSAYTLFGGSAGAPTTTPG